MTKTLPEIVKSYKPMGFKKKDIEKAWEDCYQNEEILLETLLQNKEKKETQKVLIKPQDTQQELANPQTLDEQAEILDYASQHLFKIINILIHVEADFKSFILNFQQPENLEEILKNRFQNDRSKIDKARDSVLLINKFKGVLMMKDPERSTKYQESWAEFCENFVQVQAFSRDIQKVLTTFLKSIEEGLDIVSKEEAKRFRKIFFGKLESQFVGENDGFKIIKEIKTEFEPLVIYKFKEGFEAGLSYFFDYGKQRFKFSNGKMSKELNQTTWITKPPKELIIIFSDEKPQNPDFHYVSEEEAFEVPKEISLEAYYQENFYKIKKDSKKRRKNLEVKIKETEKFGQTQASVLTLLSDAEKYIGSSDDKNEAFRLLGLIGQCRTIKQKEIEQWKAKTTQNNLRSFPENESKEKYVLKELLIRYKEKTGKNDNNSEKFILKTQTEYNKIQYFKKSPIKTPTQPIIAFYVQEEVKNPQPKLYLSSHIQAEEVTKQEVETIKPLTPVQSPSKKSFQTSPQKRIPVRNHDLKKIVPEEVLKQESLSEASSNSQHTDSIDKTNTDHLDIKESKKLVIPKETNSQAQRDKPESKIEMGTLNSREIANEAIDKQKSNNSQFFHDKNRRQEENTQTKSFEKKAKQYDESHGRQDFCNTNDNNNANSGDLLCSQQKLSPSPLDKPSNSTNSTNNNSNQNSSFEIVEDQQLDTQKMKTAIIKERRNYEHETKNQTEKYMSPSMFHSEKERDRNSLDDSWSDSHLKIQPDQTLQNCNSEAEAESKFQTSQECSFSDFPGDDQDYSENSLLQSAFPSEQTFSDRNPNPHVDFYKYLFDGRYDFERPNSKFWEKFEKKHMKEIQQIAIQNSSKLKQQQIKIKDDNSISILRLQYALGLASSKQFSKALLATHSIYKGSSYNQDKSNYFAQFNRSLYQIMLLNAFRFIDKSLSLKKPKEQEILDYTGAISFCLGSIWETLPLKYQDQIQFYASFLQQTLLKMKLESDFKQKLYSKLLRIQEAKFPKRDKEVESLIKEIEAKSLKEKKINYKDLGKKYYDFKILSKPSITFERDQTSPTELFAFLDERKKQLETMRSAQLLDEFLVQVNVHKNKKI